MTNGELDAMQAYVSKKAWQVEADKKASELEGERITLMNTDKKET